MLLHTRTRTGPHATTDVVVLPRKQAKLLYGNQNDSPSWRPGSPRAPTPATFPPGGRGASLRGPHGVGPAKVGAVLHKLPARTSRRRSSRGPAAPLQAHQTLRSHSPVSWAAFMVSLNFIPFYAIATCQQLTCREPCCLTKLSFVNIRGVIDAKRISEMKTHPTNKTKSVIKIEMKRSNSLA